jgi:ribosomal protein S18 acetylase RimI-like enzyme
MSVATPSLTLRTASPADEAFLIAVHASTRQELALVPWSKAQKDAFVRQQFDAQAFHYRTHFPDAHDHIVELEGRAVGRLYVARSEREIRVLDIALLPQFRGRGIGSALLRDLLADGAESGRTVSLHVEPSNPALRLYERLGFELVETRGLYSLLEVTSR